MTSGLLLPAGHTAGSGPRRKRLCVVPAGSRNTVAFVKLWHRHHDAPTGRKFCLGTAVGPLHVGVAIVGRSVHRRYDNGNTQKVLRLANAVTPSAPRLLYSSAWKAARTLGYWWMITYTHNTFFLAPLRSRPCDHRAIRRGERASGLRDAGWQLIANHPTHPSSDRRSHPRTATHTEQVPRILLELT